MTYLVVRRSARDAEATALRGVIAEGETVVLEGPWPLGETIIARVDDAELGALRVGKTGFEGYAVEALAEPGAGEAFVVAAHRMRDAAGFGPYAERVGEVVGSFGGRFLARAGKVTPLGGALVPDRAVIIEFPTAAEAVAFYVSDIYAPLLTIRHASTDPRFVVVARAGPLPAVARAAAESYLRAHPASSH